MEGRDRLDLDELAEVFEHGHGLPYGPGWFRYWLRRVAESRGA